MTDLPKSQDNDGKIAASNIKDDATSGGVGTIEPENPVSDEGISTANPEVASAKAEPEAVGSSTDLAGETQQDENADKKKEPLPLIKTTTKIVFFRSIYHLVLIVMISSISYTEMYRFYASLAAVIAAFTTNYFVIKAERLSEVLKGYLSVALAIMDMGLNVLLLFFYASSYSSLLLAFPIFTLIYGLNGINIRLGFVCFLSMVFYFFSEIAFNKSFNLKIGFFSQVSVLLWIGGLWWCVRFVKKNPFLRYQVISLFNKIGSKIPKQFIERLSSVFVSEKFDALEFEFRKKFTELIGIINQKQKKIDFLGENLRSEKGDEFTENINMDSAISEVNSLLEMENLSLKESNHKLMEVNKSMEERIRILTQELEITNSELERTYSSIKDDEEPVADEEQS